jgi:hypothetical protein
VIGDSSLWVNEISIRFEVSCPSNNRMAHIMAEGSLASSLCDGGPNGYFTGDPDAIPEPLVFETYSQASSGTKRIDN